MVNIFRSHKEAIFLSFYKEEIYLNCKTTCEKNTYCTLLNVAKNLINKLILDQFAQYWGTILSTWVYIDKSHYIYLTSFKKFLKINQTIRFIQNQPFYEKLISIHAFRHDKIISFYVDFNLSL